MACGACGQKRMRPAGYSDPWIDATFNDVGTVQLAGDTADCERYSGAYKGTSVYIAGPGTEHEKIFLKPFRLAAMQYAKDHGVKVTRLVGITALCAQKAMTVVPA